MEVSMGKSSVNGQLSIAMLNNQRVHPKFLIVKSNSDIHVQLVDGQIQN